MLEFLAYCQKELLSNEAALAYLMRDRGISMESIREFSLGYYPKDSKTTKVGDVWVMALMGCIIVPIRSEFGEVVGIAGKIPDKGVKSGWRNTRFHKSGHLYGIDDARKHILRKNKAYVCEGYVDRIVLAQHGLRNSVAVMSSNLGMRRVGVLARYCDEICLVFDTDANLSGTLGMLKTLAELWSVKFGKRMGDVDIDAPYGGVTTIRLPVGVDPDDYVRKHGLEQFLALEKPMTTRLMMAAEAACEGVREKIRIAKRRSEEKHD